MSARFPRPKKKRAQTYRFEHLKKNYVAGQGFLRIILSLYLDTEPRRIAFDQNQYGKPFLSGRSGPEALEFNLSHSHRMALYALTRGRRIGVDVEYLRDIPDIDAIVARFFSPGERNRFFALPDNQKKQAFYRGWTQKEAFIKAVGRGLYLPLDRFEVSLTPGETPRLLWMQGEPDEAARWSMESLTPAPGYLGAVAVEGRRLKYSYWRMPGRETSFNREPGTAAPGLLP